MLARWARRPCSARPGAGGPPATASLATPHRTELLNTAIAAAGPQTGPGASIATAVPLLVDKVGAGRPAGGSLLRQVVCAWAGEDLGCEPGAEACTQIALRRAASQPPAAAASGALRSVRQP